MTIVAVWKLCPHCKHLVPEDERCPFRVKGCRHAITGPRW